MLNKILTSPYVITPIIILAAFLVIGGDLLTSVISFIFIAILMLYATKLNDSLSEQEQLESKFKKDCVFLKVVAKRRAKEQKSKQLKKIEELYHFAEFGRLSAGLFHNLSNHLTALSLNLNLLNDSNKIQLDNAKNHLEKSINESKKLEDFVMAVQKQMQSKGEIRSFSIIQEIKHAMQILSYKACKANIVITLKESTDREIIGDSVKFNQVLVNLISNSIDAYEKMPNNENIDKKIIIQLLERDRCYYVIIEDFGCGMSNEHLHKIFEPFFTTKKDGKGTGIGMPLSKNIIEKDFHGKLKIKSEEDKGTKFIIKLPIQIS